MFDNRLAEHSPSVVTQYSNNKQLDLSDVIITSARLGEESYLRKPIVPLNHDLRISPSKNLNEFSFEYNNTVDEPRITTEGEVTNLLLKCNLNSPSMFFST